MTTLPQTPWRIAILSDTHGDFVAFKKVIADLESTLPVDEVLLGGDLAQGGPQPAQVLDEIQRRGWCSVRGNADDLLVRIADGMPLQDALRYGEHTHGPASESTARRAEWSASHLEPDHIDYLRNLPTTIERGPFKVGRLRLFHATPWSTEDVVLPDADEELARRVVREADASIVAYGHLHTPYQRRVGDAVLMSVGAIFGSNDADPRPAYTIISVGGTVEVEVRRVDCPPRERLAAYEAAGLDSAFFRNVPGPWPIRSQANTVVRLWP